MRPRRPLRYANVERLIDIQPLGEANFCADFPDYSTENVRRGKSSGSTGSGTLSQYAIGAE